MRGDRCRLRGTRRRLPVDPNRNVALQDPHCVETWMCGAISSQGLSYVARGCSPPQGFFLCNDSFQPRNVLQQALAGQDEKVITELRILKVDFENPETGAYPVSSAYSCKSLQPEISRKVRKVPRHFKGHFPIGNVQVRILQGQPGSPVLRVVALGKIAAGECARHNIEHIAVCHPSRRGSTNEKNAIEIAEAIAALGFGGAIRTPSHQTTGKWNSRNVRS